MQLYPLYIISLLALLPHFHDHLTEASYAVPDYKGETMQYQLKYGIFTIGYATISFLDVPGECGVHISAEAHSTGLIKLIKEIDYRFEACMDPATGLPRSATRSLRDGNYSVYNELIFDQHSRSDSAIIYSQLSGKHVVQKNIYDILTGFFHFRKNQMQECRAEGDSVVVRTYFTDMLWDLNIRYGGEEPINTKYGRIDCIEYKPETVIGRYFRHNDDMLVWFTRDEISIPVKIKLNLIIGSLKGDLVAYQNPKNFAAHQIIK